MDCGDGCITISKGLTYFKKEDLEDLCYELFTGYQLKIGILVRARMLFYFIPFNLPLEYNEKYKNYFVHIDPVLVVDEVLVNDERFLQEYLDNFDFYIEDFYHPNQPLDPEIDGKYFRLYYNSTRSDTSLS